MEYLSLVFLHVAFGVLWAGGAIVLGLFIIPSVMDAGSAGGAVMAGILKRRLPVFLSVSAFVVVLSGVRMYMIRFTPEWLTTAEGLAITIGGLLGLGAFVLGFFIQRPLAGKLGAMAARVAASGAPPTPDQAAELAALRGRLRRVAALTAWHLIGATLLMSIHRMATMF
jgi:uncharacterized membrane protein